jgi:hypothetical protein
MQANARSAQSQAIQQGWREICEHVASQTELSEELASLTVLLKLPLSCCEAVHQVLKEGNWAKAEYPRTYIKKAAMTQARKMHLAVPLKDDTLECGGAPLVFMGGNELDRCTTPEGIESSQEREYREIGKTRPSPLKGKHYTLTQLDWNGEHRLHEEMISENKPGPPPGFWTVRELAKMENGQPILEGSFRQGNWKQWAQAAGLDSWDMEVIEYKRCAVSREAALAEQPDEVSRKALQAAWRRFDRTTKMKLREYAKKFPS